MRFKSAFAAAGLMMSLATSAFAQSAPIDFNDPTVKAQVDAYLDTWLHENAGKIYEVVQQHLQAEQAKNTPQVAEFVSRAAELISPDAPHDGADLAGAKLVVVEFFDFNCPFCMAIHKEFNALKDANPDVAFVYRDFPILLDSSTTSAEAGRAAMAQGKYSAYADAIFTGQPQNGHAINEELIIKAAEKAGLDMDRFAQDRASQEAKDGVQKTAEQARSFRITGTPFLFIWSTEHRKGFVVPGMAEAAQLQSLFDAMKRGEEIQ